MFASRGRNTRQLLFFSLSQNLTEDKTGIQKKVNNLSFYFSRRLEQKRCEDERLTALIRV